MSKFKAEVNTGHGHDKSEATAAAAHDHAVEDEAHADTHSEHSDIVTTVATIGVIGVAAALIEVSLVPGIIVGVVAAFAPKVVPKLGERIQPLFNSTVRGAYKMTRKARSAMAEAHERINDLTAEVDAEHTTAATAVPNGKAVAGAAV